MEDAQKKRTHIAMAKKTFMRTKQPLTKALNLQTKKNIVKSIICSVALYGLEIWTLLEKKVKNIEAFEMRVWRHMEKTSCKDRVTNEHILRRIDEPRRITDIIRRRKKWIRQLIQTEGILSSIIEGQY